MKTLFIFRFNIFQPSNEDLAILNSASKADDESFHIHCTEHGVIAILNSRISVGHLQLSYRREEQKQSSLLPVLIINLTNPEIKSSASFFNMNQVRSISQSLLSGQSIAEAKLLIFDVDELLDKINELGINSLDDYEKQQLEAYSLRLRNS